MSGPEVCRTEYISECWTRNEPHQVVDDVPKCRTEYEEKCEYTQVSKTRAIQYISILYSTYIFAERLRDGPEVQQVAKGGLHHRQGVQIQGEFHERCQYSFRDAPSGKPGDQVREDTAEAVRTRGLRVCAWA